MIWIRAGSKERSERSKFAIGRFIAGNDIPSDTCSVDYLKLGPWSCALQRSRLKKTNIERCVMCNENRIFGRTCKFKEGEERLSNFWSCNDHRISNPRKYSDKRGNRGFWVNESLKFSNDLATANLYRSNLGNCRAGVRASCCFQIDHNKSGVNERTTYLVKCGLPASGTFIWRSRHAYKDRGDE